MEYPAQLEAELRRSGCYEVINAAVPGLTVRGLIQLWKGWVSRFRPDIVVVYPTPGFYLANTAPEFPRPPSGNPPAPPPWWTPRLVERAQDVFEFPEFIQRRRVAQRLAEATRTEPGWAFSSLPPDRLAQFEADVDALTEASSPPERAWYCSRMRPASAAPSMATIARRWKRGGSSRRKPQAICCWSSNSAPPKRPPGLRPAKAPLSSTSERR